jgi:hypothetical protein
MTYYYSFPNLKHHGMVNIVDISGEFIDDLEIWCCEDFPKKEWEKINFCCERCIGKFQRRHQNMKVSENVLRKLGLIYEEQEETVRQ